MNKPSDQVPQRATKPTTSLPKLSKTRNYSTHNLTKTVSLLHLAGSNPGALPPLLPRSPGPVRDAGIS